jgi:hypothetical protein
MTRRGAFGILAAASALLWGGCGYSLSGRGVTLDPSIRRIGVPTFKDLTDRAGLDQKITEKVIAELVKRGRYDVVQDAMGVDALLEGELTTYRATPIGFSSAEGSPSGAQASRYAITLVARVRFAKTGAAEAIWANDSYSASEDYDMGEDPSTYFDKEEQAIERLSSLFARNLVAAMLEAF